MNRIDRANPFICVECNEPATKRYYTLEEDIHVASYCDTCKDEYLYDGALGVENITIQEEGFAIVKGPGSAPAEELLKEYNRLKSTYEP